jgi:acetylornithine deacetylase/succinyl-diaminopimelate desuccinylase-like protein
MDIERLIQRTLAIQAIPAPTFEEAERASFLGRALKAAGAAPVEHDDIGNVYAKVAGGSAPPVIVSAHLDSVFSRRTPLAVNRTDQQLRGPGIGDNAVSLAVLVELAFDHAAGELPGDLWLVANVGEEGLGNLIGMRRVVKRFGAAVSAYIVLEGMALGFVYHRALPVLRYRLRALTEGGHSWIHAGRPSAIHALINLGAELLKIDLPQSPRTTFNIGQICGGVSINSIADSATMELDLRSETSDELHALEAALHDKVQAAADKRLRIQAELIGERPGGAIHPDHPLVQAALRSLRDQGVADPRLKIGSTDANIPLSQGLPAVCVGITRGGGAHTLQEYIEIEPLQEGYRAVTQLIADAFSLVP